MYQRNIWQITTLLLLCAGLVGGLTYWIEHKNGPSTPLLSEEAKEQKLDGPVSPEVLEKKANAYFDTMNPKALFKTNKGTFELELFESQMPITVGNFTKLAEEGFYNGTKFHRVIDGFMIQ